MCMYVCACVHINMYVYIHMHTHKVILSYLKSRPTSSSDKYSHFYLPLDFQPAFILINSRQCTDLLLPPFIFPTTTTTLQSLARREGLSQSHLAGFVPNEGLVLRSPNFQACILTKMPNQLSHVFHFCPDTEKIRDTGMAFPCCLQLGKRSGWQSLIFIAGVLFQFALKNFISNGPKQKGRRVKRD